ncbi:MAG: hypothetical protein U0Y82_14080 [Thermoleophilia bacterium]
MAAAAVLVAMLALAAWVIVARDRAARPAPPPRRRPRRRPPGWLTEAPLPRAEAERRSLQLLRSCINPEEWEMFRDLGFLCVAGSRPGHSGPPRYRYLVYPHRPVVALLPRTLSPVRELCVLFPEQGGAPALPTGDDVLAKWMTLRADERRLIRHANVGSPGSQVPLAELERDLASLRRWVARREFHLAGATG